MSPRADGEFLIGVSVLFHLQVVQLGADAVAIVEQTRSAGDRVWVEAPARLGEHTEAILTELGFNAAEIAQIGGMDPG